jgi:hypothetical protein
MAKATTIAIAPLALHLLEAEETAALDTLPPPKRVRDASLIERCGQERSPRWTRLLAPKRCRQSKLSRP